MNNLNGFKDLRTENGNETARQSEDRVLDGPASGEKGSKGGPYMNCNPRTGNGTWSSPQGLGFKVLGFKV